MLNEKWESLALARVDKAFTSSVQGEGKEYYLISFSDNDFITQNGEYQKDVFKLATTQCTDSPVNRIYQRRPGAIQR